MQASTLGTPTNGHCGTIFVALELSRRTWLVTMHSPDRDRISHHHVAGGDHAALLRLIDETVARVARKLGSVPAVESCYEAGYDGFGLQRVLVAAGIGNFVFDPASIAVEQRSRRAKSDRIDGEVLLRTLMAYRRGEPRVVRIVRVPSVAQEDERRTSREHGRLIREQTAHINRLKSILRLYGLAVGNPKSRGWLEAVARQRDWRGAALPPRAFAEVAREHARLMLVRDQLDALEKEAASVSNCPEAAEMARRRELLRRAKGIGPVFAAVTVNEALYKDFRNRREVGAYFGLAPSPWRSGSIEREQGISKAGNPRAREKAIEMAWLWLQHQPDSALTRWFKARTVNAGKRIRRIAIVALARKLVVALWRYLTCGLVPEGAVIA
jgi:transposase